MPTHELIAHAIPPQNIAVGHFQSLTRTPGHEVDSVIEWLKAKPVRLSLNDCTNDFMAHEKRLGRRAPRAARMIFESLFSLEGIRSTLGWTGNAFAEFLAREAKKKRATVSSVSSTKQRLIRFFSSAAQKLEQTRKAQRVYDGLLPNFKSCSSLVEFRPIYDDSRRHVQGGIITATLTLSVLPTDSESKISAFSVQLDAIDIETLTQELKLLNFKLLALRKLVSEQHTVLLNPSKSLPPAKD